MKHILRTNLEGAVPTITLQKLVSKHATLEEPGQNARPQNTTIFQFNIDRARRTNITNTARQTTINITIQYELLDYYDYYYEYEIYYDYELQIY